MNKQKRKEIIKWMCEHWQSADLLDDSVSRFGNDKEIICFCDKISKKISSLLATIPSYFERRIVNGKNRS